MQRCEWLVRMLYHLPRTTSPLLPLVTLSESVACGLWRAAMWTSYRLQLVATACNEWPGVFRQWACLFLNTFRACIIAGRGKLSLLPRHTVSS